MFCYTLDDEIKSFYKTNEMYLILVYRSETDFIESIRSLNYDNIKEAGEPLTRYDIVNCNVKIAKERYVEDEMKQLNQLENEYFETKNLKQFNKLEKEISKLNKIIDKKIKFIKTFYSGLEIN